MHVREMMAAHPQVVGDLDDDIVRCIERCFDCAQTCIACADASGAEETVQHMRKSIRACSDCADVCLTTGAILTRRTENNEKVVRQALEACITACDSAARECEKHLDHEHCRICGEVCRLCAAVCRAAVQSLGHAFGHEHGILKAT